MNDILEEIRPRAEHITHERSQAMLEEIMSTEVPRRKLPPTKAIAIAAASVVVVGAGATLGASLLSGDNQPTVVSDCQPRLRMDGIVFEQRTYAEAARSAEVGKAELSNCDDLRKDATGAFFPEDPDRAAAWSLLDLDPTQVIGVRQPDGSFSVYIALKVTPEEIQDILDRLQP